MRIVEFGPELANPVELFASNDVTSLAIGLGRGEAHVYCVYFDASGQIGQHEAGFCQLLLVVQGSGWAADSNGKRIPLKVGQGAFFERGEIHSKGSETGMMAIMVQVAELEVAP